MRTIIVFKRDDIGPKIVDTVLQILKAAKAPLAYECFEVGEAGYEHNGKLVPDAALTSFEKNRTLLKAPITTPIEKRFHSLSVTLRNKYDLYADIRPVKPNMAVKTPFDHVDIVTSRGSIEDSYIGVEKRIDADMVYTTKVITRKTSTRIIQDAFAHAQADSGKKATCVYKANILKMSDEIFLSIFQEVAKNYSDVEADDKIVDNVCMQLVIRPETFDVMVIPSLYGNIVSDLTSGLIGRLGLLPNNNIRTNYAMFEATHGPAPDVAGKHVANPMALLWSVCIMLEHLQEGECAVNVHKAMDAAPME